MLFRSEKIFYSIKDVNILDKNANYSKFEYQENIYELNIGGDLVVKVDRKAQIYEVNEVESYNVITNNVSFEDNKVYGSALFNDVVTSDVTFQIKFRNNTDQDVVFNDVVSNTSVNLNYEFIDFDKGTIVKAGDLVSFNVKLSLNSGIVNEENFEFVFDIQEYIE